MDTAGTVHTVLDVDKFELDCIAESAAGIERMNLGRTVRSGRLDKVVDAVAPGVADLGGMIEDFHSIESVALAEAIELP